MNILKVIQDDIVKMIANWYADAVFAVHEEPKIHTTTLELFIVNKKETQYST